MYHGKKSKVIKEQEAGALLIKLKEIKAPIISNYA